MLILRKCACEEAAVYAENHVEIRPAPWVLHELFASPNANNIMHSELMSECNAPAWSFLCVHIAAN